MIRIELVRFLPCGNLVQCFIWSANWITKNNWFAEAEIKTINWFYIDFIDLYYCCYYFVFVFVLVFLLVNIIKTFSVLRSIIMIMIMIIGFQFFHVIIIFGIFILTAHFICQFTKEKAKGVCPQVSKILLNILADLNNSLIRIVSILALIFNSSGLLLEVFGDYSERTNFNLVSPSIPFAIPFGIPFGSMIKLLCFAHFPLDYLSHPVLLRLLFVFG